jgi:GDP-D-mannose dehydratase
MPSVAPASGSNGAARAPTRRASIARRARTLVAVDPRYFRPTEVEYLLGNPAKAIRELGWNPQQTSFEQLVQKMVDHDRKAVAHAHR